MEGIGGVGKNNQNTINQPDSLSGKGAVSEQDADQFSDLLQKGTEKTTNEKKGSSEAELRDLIVKNGFKQFIERSKELNDELKKSIEG